MLVGAAENTSVGPLDDVLSLGERSTSLARRASMASALRA